MVGKHMTVGQSNCGDSVQASARSVRLDGDVPLNFWFGPKKARTVKFLMEVENLTIDPFGSLGHHHLGQWERDVPAMSRIFRTFHSGF